jgi:hypothetical protein
MVYSTVKVRSFGWTVLKWFEVRWCSGRSCRGVGNRKPISRPVRPKKFVFSWPRFNTIAIIPTIVRNDYSSCASFVCCSYCNFRAMIGGPLATAPKQRFILESFLKRISKRNRLVLGRELECNQMSQNWKFLQCSRCERNTAESSELISATLDAPVLSHHGKCDDASCTA